MKGEKIVYILGAGFSIEAKAPSQEKLVGAIFNEHLKSPHLFEEKKFKVFESFLSDTLLIPKTSQEFIPLEDIFTPIDRCLMDNLSFRDKNVQQLREIRETVYYLIGTLLKHLLHGPEKEYIDLFAKYIVEKCSIRKDWKYKEADPISVLGTNWDILLDTSLKTYIETNYEDKAVVDYCCYISSYNEYDKTVMPGLEMLGKGGFNVKYLKLHGSLNWLQCPSCQRVYVDMSNKIAIDQYHLKEPCRHCEENLGASNSHILESNLIMPTFLKNFGNAQYKIIWQNAGVELSEASKVVFIGYSLPMADFEMRQLLARMIRPNAEIVVVDYSKDSDNLDPKAVELEKRFKVFFGNRPISFEWDGAKTYITSICN